MYANNAQARLKRLSALKMRIELIAWRVQEKGMSPEIRKALPTSAIQVFDVLLQDTHAPDEYRLKLYEHTVSEVEAELANNLDFWRTGDESLH